MKRKKYTIGLIILAVIAVIGAAVVFSDHNCDMMISATIHISPEEQHTVYPVREARWSEKEHGAPETHICIDKGRLKRLIGYGPITLKGAFSCEEIKKYGRTHRLTGTGHLKSYSSIAIQRGSTTGSFWTSRPMPKQA